MKIFKLLSLGVLILFPILSFAQDKAENSGGPELWMQLLVAAFPVIIIVTVYLILGKHLSKYAFKLYKPHHDTTEESLKRIADSLEKLTNKNDRT